VKKIFYYGFWGVVVLAGIGVSATAQNATRPSMAPASTNPAAATSRSADDALSPTFITMHYTGAAIVDVLEDFSRQAHADLHARSPMILNMAQNQKIDLNLDHVGFWEAVDKISSVTGLHLTNGNGMGGSMHWDQNGGILDFAHELAQTHGPLALIPMSVSFNQSVQYPRPSSPPNVNLNFMLLAEPKVQIISAAKDKWISQLVDDKGTSIRVQNTYLNAQAPWYWNLSSNFQMPSDGATKLSTIKGEFTVNLATDFEKTEIADFNKPGAIHKVGDRTLTIKSFAPQQNNNVFEVHLSVAGEPPVQNGNRNQITMSEFEFLDAQGDSLQANNQNYSNDPVAELDIFLYPNFIQGVNRQTGPPTKIIWTVPTKVRPFTVSYEFHDLDLPVRK
jgi:hypothetical protein